MFTKVGGLTISYLKRGAKKQLYTWSRHRLMDSQINGSKNKIQSILKKIKVKSKSKPIKILFASKLKALSFQIHMPILLLDESKCVHL